MLAKITQMRDSYLVRKTKPLLKRAKQKEYISQKFFKPVYWIWVVLQAIGCFFMFRTFFFFYFFTLFDFLLFSPHMAATAFFNNLW